MNDGIADNTPFGLIPTTAYGISLLLFVVATFILLPALLVIMKHVTQGQKIMSRPVVTLLASGVLCLVGGVMMQP